MTPPRTTRRACARPLAVTLVLGAALALGACDNADNKTAGQKLDAAIDRTEQAAKDAKTKAQELGAQARDKLDASTAGTDLKNAASDAGSAIANAASDASITAAVNAGLAKDPDLSAIKINVDTAAGKVRLTGPAPSAQARARAEDIAKGVRGVASVDNQLEVKAP